MGKGKGLFERRIIRLPKNRILFEFSGISFYKLKHFVKKINKKLNFKTSIFFNHKNYFKTATKHNLIFNYYVKYLKYI
jgi:ribosomal protein L16/L10AE